MLEMATLPVMSPPTSQSPAMEREDLISARHMAQSARKSRMPSCSAEGRRLVYPPYWVSRPRTMESAMHAWVHTGAARRAVCRRSVDLTNLPISPLQPHTRPTHIQDDPGHALTWIFRPRRDGTAEVDPEADMADLMEMGFNLFMPEPVDDDDDGEGGEGTASTSGVAGALV